MKFFLTRPVVDVVLSSVLFVDRSLIVTVHHPVNAQNISLILLDNALRLKYNSVPSYYNQCKFLFKEERKKERKEKESVKNLDSGTY